MAEQIDEGIWRITSDYPGPRLIVFGGIHGNETTGIQLIHELLREFTEGKKLLTSGMLTLALGNLAAIEQNVRYLAADKDLNRLFTRDIETRLDGGNLEVRRAKRLAGLMREHDISIDIHSTNRPSVAFIASENTPRHQPIYDCFDAELLLTDPHFVLDGDVSTTDEYMNFIGGIGVCYETGWNQDASRLPALLESMHQLLARLGMTQNSAPPQAPPQRRVYELTKAIILDERGFEFTVGRGQSSFEPFKAGDILGRAGDELLTAESDGVIMFPKLPEHRAIGKPVGYLAILK